MAEIDVKQLAKLRDPFPAEQIGKLPKGGLFLDFVGHGYLTARFLDVDPEWNWEPFALDENGLPLLDEYGGLWIRLTLCGVTRIGYGDAGGKKGPNAVKEAIGDALRNAGMRFGAALALWCKGDPDAYTHERVGDPPVLAAKRELAALLKDNGIAPVEAVERFAVVHGGELKDTQDVTAVEEMIRHYTEITGGSQ